jgi:hypothetical protein
MPIPQEETGKNCVYGVAFEGNKKTFPQAGKVNLFG